MSPSIKRIPSDEQLPSAADVVVIGGGIVGATAAYFLTRRGLSVALVEKGYIGCEQSSRNWGWCRQQNRDARELPLSGVALRLWDELTAEIGRDLGFRRCGLLYATDDPTQLNEWERWRDTARAFNINTKMLSSTEAAATIPVNGRRWLGGVHSVDDGKAEPALAAPMIAEGARDRGATIHQDCAARGLEITNGAVTGVMTEKGFIRANAVLCAAGAWHRPSAVVTGFVFLKQACVRLRCALAPRRILGRRSTRRTAHLPGASTAATPWLSVEQRHWNLLRRGSATGGLFFLCFSSD